MNFRKALDLKKALPLAFSFLMPPQIVTQQWDWKTREWKVSEDSSASSSASGRQQKVEEIKVKKARRIDKVSDRAFLHRWTKLSGDSNRISWPDLDTGRWTSVSAWTGGEAKDLGEWKSSELKDFENPKDIRLAGLRFGIDGKHSQNLELKDPQRPQNNVWSLSLVGKNFEWQSDGVMYLSALDRESNSFYWMNPRSFKRITRWEWSSDVEIVELLMCPGREMLLVENIWSEGLSRVVGFRDGLPKWYTVYDFTNGKKNTTISQVLSRNCRDVYFATTSGLFRVSY
ncbi:hypothetical protein GW916_08540 [bacterium]|nr:hypothetical protein [bacterium]